MDVAQYLAAPNHVTNVHRKESTETIFNNILHHKVNQKRTSLQTSLAPKLIPLRAKAGDSNQSIKPTSVICSNCDGNGAVQCSQYRGDGVNSVDFFNGQFKAGESCWLCGGKKDMLCGDCDGAGFVGGFMSTQDELNCRNAKQHHHI